MKKIMTKRKKPQICLEITAVSWKKVRGLKKRLESAASLTLACLPENLIPSAQRAEMVILLTTDRMVQNLNRDFRGVDKPTNVLSFPSFSRRDLIRQKGEIHVGDIAMAFNYVAKEAKKENKILLDHVTHLMIHGILHLFGFDHDTAAKAKTMEKLEKEIMMSLGLPDPYAMLPEKK